ncbi:MAG: OB-fold nucleic acid binding domain-containing protein, partial [Candidatus Poseidoniaceae archaeon]
NIATAGPMNEKTRDMMLQGVQIQNPCLPFYEIPSRVDVEGELIAQWGPLPNHFNEPVLGAMLKAGEATIAIEEVEPGAFPNLHESKNAKVVIKNALPGVWRDQPRLYVDGNSEFLEQSSDYVGTTRIGLLRTRANVEGIVLSIRRQNGVRLDGRPWSMLAFHLWDGSHVVEVVAFGSAISERLLSLQPGENIRLIGAELGWRAGLVQLRIDVRKTRIELPRPEFTSKSI